MGMDTTIRRLRRDIANRQAQIVDWQQRQTAATNPKSVAALQSRITYAENMVDALEQHIQSLEKGR